MSEPLLEVDNLVRHYTRPRKTLFGKKPVVRALNGVSFTVSRGESFGIVGESGSGKSTLARAILALEEPTSGSVQFKGRNLFELPPERRRAARRHVQMVFQDPFGSLDPKHKVRAIVTEPLDLVDDVEAAEREARAAETLIAVGLKSEDLDKYPHEFSGGQRQRIAIARALITRPELIVADEPVSALDVSVQAQVLNLMMDLQEQFGLTYVMISHDLSVIRHVTDRVVVMKAGLIVEEGDTADVFERPQAAYTRELLGAVLDVQGEAMPAEVTAPSEVSPPAEVAPPAVAAPPAGVVPPVEWKDVPPPLAAPGSEYANPVAAIRAAEVAIASAIVVARETSTVSAETALIPELENIALEDVMSEGADLERTGQEEVPETTLEVEDSPAVFQGHNLIGDRWLDASDDRLLEMVDPSDGQIFGHIARGTSADVNLAVQAARRALEGPWGRMAAFERGRVLAALARLVLEKVDHLARLEAKDVGKPLSQARADAVALARYFEFYGGAADKIHGQTIPYHDGYTVLTLREPHGVTGHIVPWNYPMQIIGRSVGAALAMGNACVLKPGEDASLTALEIGKLALEAGLPAGVLNIVTGLGAEAGAALAAHPGIDHISFTGSVETGQRVQMIAGGHNCPVTLELGGKSPQIVFADADLDLALPFLVGAAIQNAGQTCSAGSRVLIQDWIYDEVVHRLAERFENLNVGPADRDLDCGPLINARQMKRVEGYLDQARADGIRVLATGNMVPDAPDGGFYTKPVLLGQVPLDHAVAREEIFGPVLSAIRFTDEEEAVRIANDTPYGLVAGIWTRDGGRQMRMARAIKSGQVFINNYGAGGGVELPFGGVKSSGFGREKGFEALYGFSTLKTVAIRH